MNRRSLFGRFAAPLSIDRTAKRPEHRKMRLEALEDRKVLAITVYVNDNWTELPALSNGTLEIGDSVYDAANNITASYGTTAFGTVTGTIDVPSLPGAAFINDAINATNVSDGDTVSILEGTYTESDIVVNKQLTINGHGHTDLANNAELQGAMLPYGEYVQNAAAETLIVPATSSAHVNGEFPNNTHSGIIIYSEGVTISNLRLDGSGNSGNTGAMAYHQGITTLYELQDASGTPHNYVPYSGNDGNNGANMPLKVLGAAMNTANRTLAKLYINEVTVDNTWWHGITMSANSGQQYGQNALKQNVVANATVRNVGDSGNQGANHIGILLQNIDNFDDAGGGIPFGNLRFSTVVNAGTGAQSSTYGQTEYGGNDHAENRTTFSFNMFLNNVTAGLKTVNNADSDIIQNVFSFVTNSTATGIINIHSEPTYGTNTIGLNAASAPLIGMQISDSAFGTQNAYPYVLTNNNFVGRGSGVSGGIGIYSLQTAAFTDSSFVLSHSVNVTGFDTGVKVIASNPMLSASGQATYLVTDRQGVQYNTGGIAPFNPTSFGVSGNKTGYAFGPNYSRWHFRRASHRGGSVQHQRSGVGSGHHGPGPDRAQPDRGLRPVADRSVDPAVRHCQRYAPGSDDLPAGLQSARRDSHRFPDLGSGDHYAIAAQRQRRRGEGARQLHDLGRLGRHSLRRCQRQYQPLEYRLHHSGAVGSLVIG